MKCVLQLVRRHTGGRSPVLTEERSALADILKKALSGYAGLPAYHEVSDELQPHAPFCGDDYVLVLADVIIGDDNQPFVDFSNAPMMTIEHFVKSYSIQPEGI